MKLDISSAPSNFKKIWDIRLSLPPIKLRDKNVCRYLHCENLQLSSFEILEECACCFIRHIFRYSRLKSSRVHKPWIIMYTVMGYNEWFDMYNLLLDNMFIMDTLHTKDLAGVFKTQFYNCLTNYCIISRNIPNSICASEDSSNRYYMLGY